MTQPTQLKIADFCVSRVIYGVRGTDFYLSHFETKVNLLLLLIYIILNILAQIMIALTVGRSGKEKRCL